MVNYLLKLLVLIIFSFLIILVYYSTGLNHTESFVGYTSYAIIMGTIYIVYKFFQIQFGGKRVSFSLVGILGLFLLHLFILSTLYFSYNLLDISSGLMLFFSIIKYSIIPILIIVLSISFGKKLINLLKIDSDVNTFNIEEDKNGVFTFLLSLGIGFFSFLFLLTTIGILGFYNLTVVFLILLFFTIFSFRELFEIFNGFTSYKISYKNHNLVSNNFIKNLNLKLLSTEFLFIVATLIISVNLINIVRPMPIGWDDLGVYMNFPRQLAYAGEIFSLGGMYSWQVFTGIGFMLGEPNQAFFLNNVGGILSFIVIVLILSDLLKQNRKTFLNIPLLMATVFISMPMVIFQQAKDMKLDPGLFFISIIALYVLYKTFFTDLFKKRESLLGKIKEKLHVDDKEKKSLLLKILFLIGIIVGFAFSIKFTSLILISAIIGALFYIKIGGYGFLGYLGIYFSIFTKAGLWNYLNVSYPKENFSLINNFSVISFLIGIFLIIIGIKRHGLLDFKKLLFKIAVFLVGVLIALSPWLAKNIYESKGDLSLSILLNGKAQTYNIDYTKIHSQDYIDEIKSKYTGELNKSGTTSNEDFGRYFGYEEGINNYVKLPWNLTMQLNQGGEFTTIGFLFLALLPTLLLFLPYKKEYFSLGIIFFLTFEVLLFIIPSTRLFLTEILSGMLLPGGYSFIFGMFILGVVYLLLSLKNTKLMSLFKINLVFTGFYVFLWSISAFGIIWYGIVMFFGFMLMIAISMYYLVGYRSGEEFKNIVFKFFGALIIFSIFLVWIFASVFPHSFNNLKKAGYSHFKTGEYESNELIFLYHRDYLKMLYHLNIDRDKRQDFLLSNTDNKVMKELLKPYLGNIYKVNDLLRLIEAGGFKQINLGNIDSKNKAILKKEARSTRLSIYKGILRPDKKYKNQGGVYRLGTFLKYFIIDNNYRVGGDSLITSFDRYIYDKNPDISAERIKKLGFDFVLADLNAATIDRDPRHDLTRRYEELLKSFTSNKLDLVETDSICLKLALENYKYSEKNESDLNNYLLTAGVNYESYKDDGTSVNRNEKLLSCYKNIAKIISDKKIVDGKYDYLKPVEKVLSEKKAELDTPTKILQEISKNAIPGARVLFELK